MDLEKRVSNLENLVNALIKRIDLDKMYNNADLQGQRQSISNITPYTETKTAYIGDAEIIFEPSEDGKGYFFNIIDTNGNNPEYITKITPNGLVVKFTAPLESVTYVSLITIK